MNRLALLSLAAAGLVTAFAVRAQQSETFGPYEVHYNVLNSDQIPAQVAQGYGIKRSSNRALLNVTIMDKSGGEPGVATRAAVEASAVNLTGQLRQIPMREIVEPEDAVYYIGELPVTHMETYNFTVTATVAGQAEPFVVKFRQQIYTE